MPHAINARPQTAPEIRTELRAIDGNRSPFFAVLKRRVDLRQPGGNLWRLELAEQRTLVVPWLRIPYWTYWRKRVAHSHTLKLLEVAGHTFLETGHVPVQWWL